MAKRKKAVVIENAYSGDYTLRVWSDLTVRELRAIEGVSDAFDSIHTPGSIIVGVDARYDPREVKIEIRKLARERSKCS